MSFSFTGAATTSAHKHSAAGSDGGTLDNTTLINGAPLFSMVIALG